jgi:hypothetical protein
VLELPVENMGLAPDTVAIGAAIPADARCLSHFSIAAKAAIAALESVEAARR